jgi:DnaJ-class molecular chaperone
MEDLFWGGNRKQTSYRPKQEEKPESLDFEKTYEIPIFDFILGWTLAIKWVYWQEKTIKVPAWTKPWIKMRIKWFWKKEAGREGNLLIKLEAKMPKYISDMDKQMLERIGDWIWY